MLCLDDLNLLLELFELRGQLINLIFQIASLIVVLSDQGFFFFFHLVHDLLQLLIKLFLELLVPAFIDL